MDPDASPPAQRRVSIPLLVGATFFDVVPRDFMVFTTFSRVLLRLLISLLVFHLGLGVLRVAIFSLSLVVWVGAAFALLRL